MSSIPPTTDGAMLGAVIEVLNQGQALLSALDNENYVRRIPSAFNASIGGHYRHCLDHFHTLLEASQEGHLNYDHRERGTRVETDRFAALEATRALQEAYGKIPLVCLARKLEVTCKTSYESLGSQTSGSTVGRELMYVVAHAVHHYALIGIMGSLMGLKMPPGFGVAPSTAKYREEVTAGIRKMRVLWTASLRRRLRGGAQVCD